MIEGKGSSMPRWAIVLSAAFIQLSLGSAYAWSIFNNPLVEEHKSWSVFETAITFGVYCLCVALGALSAGQFLAKFGVRRTICGCGIFLGLGIGSAGASSYIWQLYVTFGLISGLANGLAYLSTLTTAIQWFPQHRGLISGVVILFYGLGSFVYKYILVALMNRCGVNMTFLYWGILVGTTVVIGSQFQRDVPSSKDAEVALDSSPAVNNSEDYSWKDLCRCPQAYMLFWMMLTTCMGGTYFISVAANFAQDVVHLSSSSAANAVVVLSLTNTSGRLIEGYISDYLPRLGILLFNLCVMIGATICLEAAGDNLNMPTFSLLLGCIAFCFGGSLTVYPPLVGELFGQKNLTINYSIIYQGFGIGAVVATVTSAVFSNYSAAFWTIVGCAILASVLDMIIIMKKPPTPPRNKQNMTATLKDDESNFFNPTASTIAP